MRFYSENYAEHKYREYLVSVAYKCKISKLVYFKLCSLSKYTQNIFKRRIIFSETTSTMDIYNKDDIKEMHGFCLCPNIISIGGNQRF